MGDSRLKRVLVIGRWEGVSYLLLLGVAMPMKYLMGMPLAVRIVGMAHGLLFIAYCAVVWDAAREHGWEWRKSALFYLASLLPFGPFLVESRLEADGASGAEKQQDTIDVGANPGTGDATGDASGE